MANLAKDAREKAQVIWPGASIHSRGKSWIRHQHPTNPNQYILDSHIGTIHYGPLDDQEIDTAWEPGELPDSPWLWKMVKSRYNVYCGSGTTELDSGQLLSYVHPETGATVTLEIQQMQWINDNNQLSTIADPQKIEHTAIVDDKIFWDDAFGPGINFRWDAQTSRLAKYVTILSQTAIGEPPQFIIDGGNPMLRLSFIFQLSSDIDIYIGGVLWNKKSNNPQETFGDVEFRLAATGETLWYFKRPTVTDSSIEITESPIIKQKFRAVALSLFVDVLVPWSWLESAVYPVEIDPTIDEQVAVSTDDGYVKDTGYDATGNSAYTGHGPGITNARSWFRWPSISGLSGATIDVSYFEPFLSTSGTVTKSNIYAEDAAAPAYPTSQADYEGKTTTTALVAWDDETGKSLEFVQSPSINTVIQELADSYDSSVIQILWKNDGSANGNWYRVATYDGSSTFGAKLHIEYTAASTANVPAAIHSYRQRRL